MRGKDTKFEICKLGEHYYEVYVVSNSWFGIEIRKQIPVKKKENVSERNCNRFTTYHYDPGSNVTDILPDEEECILIIKQYLDLEFPIVRTGCV